MTISSGQGGPADNGAGANDHDLRTLVARLCDGSLAHAEFQQLNDLLKADPIAQEMYLDHLLMDGLLEREFGGTPSLPAGRVPLGERLPAERFDGERLLAAESGEHLPTRLAPASRPHSGPSRSRWRQWVLAPLMLVPLAAVGWMLHTPQVDRPARHLLTLADGSFESDLPRSVGKKADAAWYGDVAHVVRQFSGVTPLEGDRMLRFVKSTSEPERSCELYQIVDLSDVKDLVASGSMTVEASAHFNAVEEVLDGEEYSFGITVFAYPDDPAEDPQLWPMRWETPLTFSGGQTTADTDTGSWQKVATRLSLPAGTRYLVVQLAAIRTDSEEDDKPHVPGEPREFPGQFADRVLVSLIEP